MSNHAHFLLRCGLGSIAHLMRRLLTGYAVSFNRRYCRHGQFFQNRYKSIIIEEVENRVMEIFGVEKEVIYSKGRRKIQVAARSLLCYWAFASWALRRPN
jgi:hypothetical protein